MDFKQSINDSLEKMCKQIQQYVFPIQKEKQELQEFESQLSYFEDITQLSKLYSQEQQQSPKLIQDNHFINEIQIQFELLFISSEYFQTVDTFKNTKEIIKDIIDNNVIELVPSNITKNDSKTPSLSRICSYHKKEIIMIDIDSQKQKIEDRFACVDCIYENPQIQYQTIENIDKQWKEYNTDIEKIITEYNKESKGKKSELLNQLGQMRRNYNKKLNEISENLIDEQFLSINKTKQTNQIQNISIKTLDDEQLLKDLRQLIKKEKVTQSQIITNLKNKDQIFKKDLQYQLESLHQYNQQDIQQSLEILKEVSIEKDLIMQLTDKCQDIQQCAQEDENYINQINFIKEIQDLIDLAKKHQCQQNLFDQTILIYQQHFQKIEYIKQNILIKTQDQAVKSEQLKSQYSKLSNILNEYANTYDNNTIQMKKYCMIKQLESDIVKLRETNSNLEVESKDIKLQIEDNLISSMQKQFKYKLNETNIKKKEQKYKKMKEQLKNAVKDNIKMKKQYEQDKTKMMEKFEDECKENKVKFELIKDLTQKNSELQEALMKLDQINQVKSEQEKYSKMEIEKIQQFKKSLSFSNNYKSANCQVSEDAKIVAEVVNDGYWYYCLCEQAIPKTGKIQFAFQIISGQGFMVGIGFREIMQRNNYKSCYYTGFGTYLILNDGCIFSHHNEDLHHKKQSFAFTTNDVIIVEVCIEHKYIKWSKSINPQLMFVLDIDTSQELYPCLGVFNQSKIKLLHNIP
ncbi:unnamed protein product (macronuclear) [Paramecium tetraurelia]|uniref:B30.2/SPRY domain-containing protein n=1 Tax=Paramecium tetraurelia TaxID=5888 RepID=A0DBT9_PARTE|nr:uncharacterized protein GSPATT00039402001 [Paramecium tetraurelia]CAK80506.1 unnamed protein product [Paramecium tetraurelia]|eukprot:XP_001447903.1 hypothetical protein (macronuclear) [Paramecium tetraurelia strain d4-2]